MACKSTLSRAGSHFHQNENQGKCNRRHRNVHTICHLREVRNDAFTIVVSIVYIFQFVFPLSCFSVIKMGLLVVLKTAANIYRLTNVLCAIHQPQEIFNKLSTM